MDSSLYLFFHFFDSYRFFCLLFFFAVLQPYFYFISVNS